MDKDKEIYSNIKFITTPKWAIPLSLFISITLIVTAILFTSENWAFGNLFPFTQTEAQDRTFSGPSKFGVNSANWVGGLSEDVVYNTAALTGPGGTVVGLVSSGTDINSVNMFVEAARKYCLTPILRISLKPEDNPLTPEGWGGFFTNLDSDDGKLVISIGNEVNYYFEWEGVESYSGDGAGYAKYLADTIDAIRPHAGGAKLIGSPLNTSAPCPGNDKYTCWYDFVSEMNSSGVDWQSKVDGHASNPYPVEYSDTYGTDVIRTNDRIVNYYDVEMDVMGYSKSVYILETGPHNGTATAGTAEFMKAYWEHYCKDSSLAVVNMFNAAGNNTDSQWNGGVGNFVFDGSEVTDEQVYGCGMADMDIRYLPDENGTYSYCKVVDRSEYSPMASTGGAGGSTDIDCVADVRTTLLPEEQFYTVNGEIQLKNGYGGGIAELTIKSVAVTKFLESLELGNDGKITQSSASGLIEKTLRVNVNNQLIAYYPADGTYYHKAVPRIESWLNEPCAKGNEYNQLADSLGISSEYWPFPWATTQDHCGDGDVFGSRTEYGDYLLHSGISQWGYVYFPFGTGLGAAAEIDPHNIYSLWEMPEEFILDEGESYSLDLQTMPEVEHYNEFLARFNLGTEIENFFNGFPDWFDSDSIPHTETTSTGLVMMEAYTEETLPGEEGVMIGDFDYQVSCSDLQDVIDQYENEVIPYLERKKSEKCGVSKDCVPQEDPTLPPICTVTEDASGDCASYKILLEEAQGGLSTVSKQYERCVGDGGKTKIQIAGIEGDEEAQLSLTAPFVPILAQYRIWDTLFARDTVCTEAEEEIVGGEVVAEVKWYDKNLIERDTVPGCSEADNILVNGDMEDRGTMPILEWRTGSDAGTGDVVASGVLPVGWDALWRKDQNGGGKFFANAPEFKPMGPYIDPRRVLTGSLSSQWFSSYNSHDVILFQEVNLNGYAHFSGFGMMWRNDKDQGATKDGNGCSNSNTDGVGDGFLQACVVPAGELDIPADREYGPARSANYDYEADFASKFDAWASSNPQYCTTANPTTDAWQEHTLDVNITGAAYVILRGVAELPYLNTDDYWDNICLVDDESKMISVPKTILLSAPARTGSPECDLYNESTNECVRNSVSNDVLTESAVFDTQEINFYVPGIGAIASMADRIQTGINKSPDITATDMHYCIDRSDSEVSHPYSKVYSYLDLYIIQNLPYKYAHEFAKQIAPAQYSEEEVDAIIEGETIENSSSNSDSSKQTVSIPEGYDREEIDQERDIMDACKDAGLDRLECAYVLATVRGESGFNPSREEIGCSCPDGCSTLSDGNTRSYGDPDPRTGKCYYGRGYVQLTGYNNYYTYGGLIRDAYPEQYENLNLLEDPEDALEPDLSLKILVTYFVEHDIKNNINTEDDYLDARAMVNRNDTSENYLKFAEYARGYYNGSIMDDIYGN